MYKITSGGKEKFISVKKLGNDIYRIRPREDEEVILVPDKNRVKRLLIEDNSLVAMRLLYIMEIYPKGYHAPDSWCVYEKDI